jgi:hypothetical protein
MTTETPAPAAPETSVYQPVRRGIAAASLCIGFWSLLVFWWYPYSIFIATVGLVLGLAARVSGWRVEAHGANLAFLGVVLNLLTIGTALTAYRVMQFFFEHQVPLMPLDCFRPSEWPHW